MITDIELENVRLFEGQGWRFRLKPITVLCGTNSSGKSTVLKILPLLRQSMGIEESYGPGEGTLRLTGSQVDLGEFGSFVSHGDTTREISIVVSTQDDMPTAAAARLRDFFANGTSDARTIDNRDSYTLRSQFRFALTSDSEPLSDTTSPPPARKASPASIPSSHPVLTALRQTLTLADCPSIDWEAQLAGFDEDGDALYDLFIPERYFDTVRRLRKTLPDRDARPSYVRITAQLRALTPAWLIARLPPEEPAGTSAADDHDRFTVEQVPEIIGGPSRNLVADIANTQYIGPLRSAAKRYYLTHLETSPPPDPAGDFLPYVLKDIDHYKAHATLPGSPLEPSVYPLSTALNAWMNFMRTGKRTTEGPLADEIGLETTKVLTEFRIRSIAGTELHALADSGFGYSQVLPILVRGLIAPPDTLLIIEQPELHLNPALQLRLTEFIAAMTRSDKRFIIETHSEHVVNALRVLAAEEESGELASYCQIYYIDFDAKACQPFLRELMIRPDGSVPRWPPAFFGEAAGLAGRLLRAQKNRKPTNAA